MEYEENNNELAELMKLLPLPGNDGFAQIDNKLRWCNYDFRYS